MTIKVKKLTDVNLLRKANGFSSGQDSHMSLKTAYRLGHSPIRTQIFSIEMHDIPLFVASQLVRSHVGVQWFQRSKRTDRGGRDFNDTCRNLAFKIRTEFVGSEYAPAINLADNLDIYATAVECLPESFDRFAPTDLMCVINAEALINISHYRLCTKASRETREIWQQVCELIEETDPDLYPYLVKPCVATGVCREAKSCGFNTTELFGKIRANYIKQFTN